MKFLSEIKTELENNDELKRLYNDRKPFRGPKWTDHELVLADARKLGLKGKDVNVFSIGRGSQISSRHCDILIVDDPESAETVKSDTVRQSTREWWSREVEPVLSPGGKLIGLGTRKHFDDLYSYWLIPGSGWKVIDVAKTVFVEKPEIAEMTGLELGDPIWGAMWDKPTLLARKARLDGTDLLAWPQEYLNNPLPSQTQMFYPEKWPTYDDHPHHFAANNALTIIQFWDLAIGEKTYNDYTVGFTIGVGEHNDVYLLERRKGHWDFAETLNQIEQMGEAWPGVTAIGVEQVAYQAAAVQEATRRTMLPILPIVPDKDKVTRARLLEARAAAFKVHRPQCTCPSLEHAVSWWRDFSTEASYFPAGAHDDQIDSLAGCLRLAGWDAASINWAYGIWTCERCKHLFKWEAKRPCPKCSLPAPETFENPEGTGLAVRPQEATPTAA